MKVKDINFLKESMQKIKCEVIKPKIGKPEEIKGKFEKDGVIEVSDKKDEYLYIHNELSVSFKIVDKNQKNKLDDYFLRKYKNIAYIDSTVDQLDSVNPVVDHPGEIRVSVSGVYDYKIIVLATLIYD